MAGLLRGALLPRSDDLHRRMHHAAWLLAGDVGRCVQNAFNASQPVPELLSLTSCAQRLSGVGWVLLDTTIDVPGVTPDQVSARAAPPARSNPQPRAHRP